jgi:NAD-dependent SIR2 family protein deacetylase
MQAPGGDHPEIDGMHQAAGSKNVLELLGSVCGTTACAAGNLRPRLHGTERGVPRCALGGVVRPDVDGLRGGAGSGVIAASVGHLARPDTLIIGGTSLVVYPAASLIHYYRGSRLILINGTPGHTRRAFLAIHKPFGECSPVLNTKTVSVPLRGALFFPVFPLKKFKIYLTNELYYCIVVLST